MNLRVVWIGLLATLVACGTTKNTQRLPQTEQNPVLFTVGELPVHKDEFLYVYNKNNFSKDSVPVAEDVTNYLELYTNFKLKVAEAYSLQLDQEEAFKEEFEGYKAQLMEPYLTDNEATDSLVRQAYDRMGYEVRASHILISATENSLPADTLKAWELINSLRQQVAEGASFVTLARQYSEDPSARQNEGDLGYFSALQMVHPFEDAAYTTPVGEVSEVVKTRFGYHILEVKDRRRSRGKVYVAHLMVRASEGMPEADLQNAAQKIKDLYQELQEGAEWRPTVEEFSDDLRSKVNEGKLPAFGTGVMPPAFEAAAFALEKPGQISEPVQTQYGWHLIKLVEKRPLPPFEELQATLTQQVSDDSRSMVSQRQFLERLKKENNLRRQATAIEEVLDTLQVRDFYKNRAAYAAYEDNVLLTIMSDTLRASNYFDYLELRQVPGEGVNERSFFDRMVTAWERNELLEWEKAHLADKYHDYRMLLREYREGILFFQLMDEMVWSKAMADTTGLRTWFEDHNDQYQWGRRVEAVVLSAADEGTLEAAREALAQPYYPIEEKLIWLNATGDQLPGQENNRILDQFADRLRKDSDLLVVLSQSKESRSQQLTDASQAYLIEAGVDSRQIVLELMVQGEGDLGAQLMTKSKKVLEKRFNEESSLTLQVDEGLFEQGDNALIDEMDWNQGQYETLKNGRYYLITITDVLPPAAKKLQEVRGLVISDYQAELEEQWLQELRTRYTVSTNEEVLNEIITELDR